MSLLCVKNICLKEDWATIKLYRYDETLIFFVKLHYSVTLLPNVVTLKLN